LDFYERADFDGAVLTGRDAGGDIDGLVKVVGINEKEAAQLFAGFRKRAVGHNAFSILEAEAGSGGGGLEGGGADEFAGCV
jgi:hypothetical protein